MEVQIGNHLVSRFMYGKKHSGTKFLAEVLRSKFKSSDASGYFLGDGMIPKKFVLFVVQVFNTTLSCRIQSGNEKSVKNLELLETHEKYQESLI